MSDLQPVPLEINCLSVQQKLQTGDDFLLLDCREADEHAAASIPQAVLIPMSEIADRLRELEPHRQQQIIVLCHVGGRSLRVARWLREQGFSQAQSMAGGIDEWSQEIDPTVPRY
jgi:rhodanese-related sulfurtransferase